MNLAHVFPPRRSFVFLGIVLGPFALAMAVAAALADGSDPLASGDQARAMLDTIAAAQSEFCARAWVDLDSDGVGEAGFFAELAGALAPRGAGTGAAAIKGLLPAAFADGPGSSVVHGEYRFRLALPATGGGYTQGPGRDADPDASERGFHVHAWPENPRNRDVRVFLFDGNGRCWVHHDEGRRWRGRANPPPLDAGIHLDPPRRDGTRLDGYRAPWGEWVPAAQRCAAARSVSGLAGG